MTLSISAIKQKFKRSALLQAKTVLSFLALSLLAIAVNQVYALFGHGVRSASMSLMFLIPLLGGALYYFIYGLICSNPAPWPFRLGYNLYNAGLATMTVGSFFHGILEIAGTASVFSLIFTLLAYVLLVPGLMLLVFAVIRSEGAV